VVAVETLVLWLALVAIVLLGAVLIVLAARSGKAALPPPTAPPGELARVVRRDGDRVVLDLEVADATAGPVRRLALDLAARTFTDDPALARLTVVDRTGRTLLTTTREEATVQLPDLPPDLSVGGRRPGRRAPDPLGRGGGSTREAGPPPHITPLGPRPFVARFDLPTSVLDQVRDGDDPVEVLGAVLRAGGRPVERHGDVLVSEDTACTVVDVSDDADRALARAFVRLRDSGAPRGIVVRLGYADPAVVARHAHAARHVHQRDVTAVQAMADAVALGADPIALVLSDVAAPARH
jgi:hypothetical protein